MNMIEQNEYGTRKLAHYNAWLMDTKREFGVPYPGFPEDLKAEKTKRVPKVTTKAPAKKAGKTVTKTKSKGKETKLDQAKALFKANVKLSRENMITLFMEKLQMSKAGATTYFYNVQK